MKIEPDLNSTIKFLLDGHSYARQTSDYLHRISTLKDETEEEYVVRQLNLITKALVEIDEELEKLKDSDNTQFYNLQSAMQKFLKNEFDFYHLKHVELRLATKQRKTNKKNLINGKQLNLADKYYLANEVFGIGTTLRDLDHLSDAERHIFLSHILGCNQQTARELYNGTIHKRTQIQEDIVNPYLKRIKGE